MLLLDQKFAAGVGNWIADEVLYQARLSPHRAVDSLDAFAAAVSAREDRSAVRLQCLDLNGRERSITLRLDLAYWPTTELRRDDEGWSRTLP